MCVFWAMFTMCTQEAAPCADTPWRDRCRKKKNKKQRLALFFWRSLLRIDFGWRQKGKEPRSGHLQSGCPPAGLRPLRAELDMSVHSPSRCASTARTPQNYGAPHHPRSPRAASSDRTPFVPRGDPCTRRTQTTTTPKRRSERGSCLTTHTQCKKLWARRGTPPSRTLHLSPSLGSTPPPSLLLITKKASSLTAHPPRHGIGQDRNNAPSHWTAGIFLHWMSNATLSWWPTALWWKVRAIARGKTPCWLFVVWALKKHVE